MSQMVVYGTACPYSMTPEGVWCAFDKPEPTATMTASDVISDSPVYRVRELGRLCHALKVRPS